MFSLYLASVLKKGWGCGSQWTGSISIIWKTCKKCRSSTAIAGLNQALVESSLLGSEKPSQSCYSLITSQIEWRLSNNPTELLPGLPCGRRRHWWGMIGKVFQCPLSLSSPKPLAPPVLARGPLAFYFTPF